MMTGGASPDPFDVVARALDRPRDSVTTESAMYRDYGWDSFGHVSVITAVEEALDIRIANDDVMGLASMRAILELFERHRSGVVE